MHWPALPGFLLALSILAFIALGGLYRRRRLPTLSSVGCAYAAWGGATVGHSFISRPFVRIEVWDGELLLSGFGLRVPLKKVSRAALARGWGGAYVRLTLSDFAEHRIDIGVSDPEALLAAIEARRNAPMAS